MKYFDEEISLSATFKRIYDNKNEINERVEKLIERWEKEDDDKLYKINKMVKK